MYFLIGVGIGFALGVKWSMDKDLKAKVTPWVEVAKKYVRW